MPPARGVQEQGATRHVYHPQLGVVTVALLSRADWLYWKLRRLVLHVLRLITDFLLHLNISILRAELLLWCMALGVVLRFVWQRCFLTRTSLERDELHPVILERQHSVSTILLRPFHNKTEHKFPAKSQNKSMLCRSADDRYVKYFSIISWHPVLRFACLGWKCHFWQHYNACKLLSWLSWFVFFWFYFVVVYHPHVSFHFLSLSFSPPLFYVHMCVICSFILGLVSVSFSSLFVSFVPGVAVLAPPVSCLMFFAVQPVVPKLHPVL